MNKLLLTFDIEDFINSNAIEANRIIFKLLEKYELNAILFITGHQAENFSTNPEILDLIKKHEIGFHSSSHSVRPIIQEFSDVKSYNEAYNISIQRETSHINPLTGQIEEDGGINILKEIFPNKRIESFRAPGMSWTPPHLEALNDIGIKFDFSSGITTSEPVSYKKVIFFPYTFLQSWDGSLYDYQCLFYTILTRKVAVFDLHPSQLVNKDVWDGIYFKGNPPYLSETQKREASQSKSLFHKFEDLLKVVNFLKKMGLVKVDTNLNLPSKDLITTKSEIDNCYEMSARWPRKFFNYNPKYIYLHFQDFFEDAFK